MISQMAAAVITAVIATRPGVVIAKAGMVWRLPVRIALIRRRCRLLDNEHYVK
jgi:hypothetical protein